MNYLLLNPFHPDSNKISHSISEYSSGIAWDIKLNAQEAAKESIFWFAKNYNKSLTLFQFY